MKSILCIRLINWPANRLLRKRRSLPVEPSHDHGQQSRESQQPEIPRPLAVLQTIADRQVIVACCDRAAALGIHPGMTLAQARALCSAIDSAPFRPDLDHQGIEALGRYLLRFTPSVALSTRDAAEHSDPREPSPSSSRGHAPRNDLYLYLDLTGCEHLYGGLVPLVRQIAQAFHRLRIPAILGAAHTPGAAHALTHRKRGEPAGAPSLKHPGKGRKAGISSPPSQISIGIHTLIASTPETFYAALPQLPLCSLRLPEEVLQSLHHLGIENIAQLQQIPRDTLPARFGRRILQRLDQLTGKLAEPLVCLISKVSLEASFEFDGSVADPQALELVFVDLLKKLLLQLERRGEGIRELQITLKTYDSPAISSQTPRVDTSFTLSVSRRSRDSRALLNLYRCAFDQIDHRNSKAANPKQKYSRNYDVGFTSMSLRIARAQLLPHRQLTVDQADRSLHQNAWQNTLDLIRTRMGETAIEQAQLHQSYLPEKAFRRLAAGVPEDPRCKDTPELGNRPLHLFSPPADLHVMVTPSHDADGAPISFSFDGTVHKVAYSIGPERIAGEWWEGHHKTRDYFDIADETGCHYWIFKVQETSKWYMHGTFE